MIKLWYAKGAWASKKAKRVLAGMKPEEVQRIAVIRHAALGDMVLTRPFLRELRRHFPNAHITLSLVSKYTRGVPEDLVDSIHVICGSDQRGVSKYEQFRRMRELGYQDLIFDLAATARSFWLCALNKAKIKVGFPSRVAQRFLFYDVAVLRSDLRFEAETMLDMLNLMGFVTEYPPDFAIPVVMPQDSEPYVLYFTGASTPLKCWPKRLFKELIMVLADQDDRYQHYVLGGIAEWESNANILEELIGYPSVKGVDANSVERTMDILRGARLVVSNDTGIRNLAIASGVPTVGLFFDVSPFTTTPFRYWPRFGRHEIVFNPDGSLPGVEQVANAIKDSLEVTAHPVTKNIFILKSENEELISSNKDQ